MAKGQWNIYQFLIRWWKLLFVRRHTKKKRYFNSEYVDCIDCIVLLTFRNNSCLSTKSEIYCDTGLYNYSLMQSNAWITMSNAMSKDSSNL